MVKGIILVAAISMLGQSAAVASEKPGMLRRMSCTLVRFYVAKYSESAAEAYARSKGATDAEIESARKCLGGASTQTALAR